MPGPRRSRGKNRKFKKRGGKRHRGGQEGNLIVRENPRFPNDIKMLPIHSRVVRYVCATALSAQPMTPGDLLTILLQTVNGSTTAYMLAQCTRLRRISMYYVPSSGDFSDITHILSFSWSGATNAGDTLITDRGTATQPACIKVKPIRDSLSSMWFDANSVAVNNTLCLMTCPTNTIIDIDYEFITSNGNGGTVTLSGAATTTGGAILGLFSGHLLPDGGMTTYHK